MIYLCEYECYNDSDILLWSILNPWKIASIALRLRYIFRRPSAFEFWNAQCRMSCESEMLISMDYKWH